MGLFDKLRSRLDDVEKEAEDAAVSVDDLRKSDDELEAELEAELAGLEDEVPAEPEPEPEPEPAPEDASTPEATEASQAEAVEETPTERTEPSPATQGPSEPEQAEPSTQVEPKAPSKPSPAKPEAKKPKRAGGYQIDPDRVEDLLWDLELVLLEADVAAEVAHELRDILEERLPQIRVDKKQDVPTAIEQELRTAIRSVLEGGSFDFDEWVMMNVGDEPLTIMFVGVNGTGKTTTIARIAYRMKELGFGIALAAGDTYRAGAIEQLEKHGDNLGLRVIKHSAGSDPAAVSYDAIEHAKARRKELVLVDTAGRMQTDSNLMQEVQKIERVADPDLTVFVGDSLAGNDAIDQAQKFDEAVDVDCCVLTKVDTDAKGGAALSIARAVGKPVAFLGVGQEYDDLIPFDPDWLIERIFGE